MTDTPASDLLDVLDTLTVSHTVVTPLDGDKKHFERHDALIKQLRQAIASNVGGGAGGKPARERIPLDADALIKYQQIEKAILTRHAATGLGVPGIYPEENLRAWYVVFIRDATEQAIRDELNTLTAWKHAIEEKLSPPTVRELAGEECPDCGFAWYDTVLNVARRDTRNPADAATIWADMERKPALTVTYRPDNTGGLTQSFAKCGNCNHVWMGSAGIRALAWAIEHHENREEETA